MRSIRYGRHFLALAASTVLLSLMRRRAESIHSNDLSFFALFGATGALHAASVVLPLRAKAVGLLEGAVKAVAFAAKAVAFVALASALSFLVFWSPTLLIPVVAMLGVSTPLGLLPGSGVYVPAFGSLCGAAAYWLVIRWFWLRSLGRASFILTAALCSATTALCFYLQGKAFAPYPSFGSVADTLPYVAWWIAFSLSLYFGELWRPKESSGLTPLGSPA